MQHFRTLWLPLLLAITTLAGCDREPQTKEYRIGAILPLTGNASTIGEQMKSGMELAVDDLNAAGGIAGKSLRVIFEDSKNDPKEGVSLFNRLTSTEKVPVVVSAMTGVTKAIIPLSATTKTVVMATGASASGITHGSDYAYRLFITADLDATTMAKFAADKLGLSKVAIVHVNDDFGVSFSRIFKSTFEANPSKSVVYEEAFEKGTTDFRSLVTKLKEVSPDGIYLLGYDNNLGILPLQIRQAGIKAPIMSIGTIGQPSVREQAGEALDGAYFTTTDYAADKPTNPEAETFTASYLKKFGKAPTYFSAFSYDAVHVLADAISEGGASPDAIRNSLSSGKLYHGAMGDIHFTSDRDADFRMIVKQIHGGVAQNAE